MGRSRSANSRPSKTCAVCGRTMEYRKKWERSWDEVKYCSSACRSRRGSGGGAELEAAIIGLLEQRARDATICPSEVARSTESDPERWRPLMEPLREAGRRLASRGVVTFRQKGQVVDPSTARGALRLGRGPRWSER